MDQDYETAFKEWMASQSGYIGKTAKAQFKSDYNQNQSQQQSFAGIFDPNQRNFSMGGSLNERQGRIEGLERAKVLTGKNPFEVGQDYQEAFGNIKKRSQLADTGSEMIRASKAGAVADARNDMQKSGVKGGAAAGAVSAIERQKAYDVNNQLVENQRKAEMDYINAAKSNANFTQASEMNYGAMALGKDVEAPPSNSNGFGTVICSELFRQGLMDAETYAADVEAGKMFREKMPAVMDGYLFLAAPIVRKMQTSKRFTKAVAFFALPWAKAMNGQESVRAGLVFAIGIPLCYITGKLIGGKYAYQKAV